jgi:WD40 repeat protein
MQRLNYAQLAGLMLTLVLAWGVGPGVAQEKLPDGSVILGRHAGEVFAVTISPDGKRAASGGRDGTIFVWDLTTNQRLHTLKGHTSYLATLAFSPDGKTLLSGGADKKIRLWDVAEGKLLTTLEGHTDAVNSARFCADGKRIVSASKDKTVRVWNWAERRVIHTMTTGAFAVNLALHPDGRRVAVGLADGQIRFWDVDTGEQFGQLRAHDGIVRGVAFSPDGKFLVSGGDDGILKVWDHEAGRTITVFPPNVEKWIRAVHFNADGKSVFSCGDNELIQLWDLTRGREASRLQPRQGFVLSLAVSADGSVLLTGGQDKSVRLQVAPKMEPGGEVAIPPLPPDPQHLAGTQQFGPGGFGDRGRQARRVGGAGPDRAGLGLADTPGQDGAAGRQDRPASG